MGSWSILKSPVCRTVPAEVRKESVFNDLDGKEVGQIWAEARVLYLLGEPLFLTGESEELAKKAQEGHQEEDAKDGIIQEFLEMEIPSTSFSIRSWSSPMNRPPD